jgi:hypothetical protein
VETRVAFVEARFAPASTVILVGSEYLTARYYLPEYRVLFYGAAPEVLSSAAQAVRVASTTVVIFGTLTSTSVSDFGMRLQTGDPVLWADVDSGSALVAFDLEPR